MALPYRSVKDIYDRLHDAGAVQQTLPEWSTEMNALSESNLYDHGLNDNFVKRASVGVDRLLESTGLPNLTGELGAGVGSFIGNEQAGREIGHSLPRMAVNFAPLAAGPWGLPAVAALSGAETYTATGSPAAGIVSAGTNLLMPGVANLAERGVLKGLGAKYLSGPIADELGNVTGQLDRYFPTAGQKLASFAGGQVAAAGFGEVSNAVQAGLDPDRDYHFSPSEAVLNMTLGQLPFAAMHLAGKVVGREKAAPTYDQVDELLKKSAFRVEEKRIRDEANQQTPIEKVPDVTYDPADYVNQLAEIASIRKQKQEIVENGDPDAERKLADLTEKELAAMEETRGVGVMGEDITPTSDRLNVVGTEHFHNPKTGYRIIKVADLPANIEKGFTPGELVGYSTKHETAPLTEGGLSQFDIPTRYHTKGVKDNRVVADAAKLVENPDLPLQEHSGLDQVREFSADLADVQSRFKAVPEGDMEGLRQVINAFNGVLQKHGFPPMNDAQFVKHMEQTGAKTIAESVAGKMNLLMLRLGQKEQLMKERDAALQRDNVALAEGVKDPEVKAMWEAFEATGRGGKGLFAKVFRQWVEGGKVGGVDGLRTRILETKRQGGVKVKEIVEKSQAAAKNDSPETQHVREMRRNVAETVIEDKFDNSDSQTFREAYADGTLKADPKLRDFAKQEHVKRWTEEADAELARLGVHEPEVSAVPRLSAGGGFVHDLVPYDEVSRKLGKHTLPKDGTLAVSQFKNMAKDQGALPDVAIELGRQLVPEAFNGDRVNVPMLMKGLKEKGPVVEVKKLGKEGNTEREGQVNRRAQIEHELDTINPNWWEYGNQGRPITELPQRAQELIAQLNSNLDEVHAPGARYSFLGPKSEQEMPGYVEGLVRVPFKREADKSQGWTTIDSSNETTGAKYAGPHFGSEDTNVLAFFRGYEETLPDGRKTFHVIEVQSDWGQRQREHETKLAKVKQENGKWVAYDKEGELGRFDTEAEAKETAATYDKRLADNIGHPLLPVYESLALKAAIDHAKSIGAKAILLSDGETAMMTEGHDKVRPNPELNLNFKSKEEAEKAAADFKAKYPNGKVDVEYQDHYEKYFVFGYKEGSPQPSQSAGMRLHYDTTLPSALAKLTGEKGERVEIGTHDKADTRTSADSDDRQFATEQEAKAFVERELAAGRQATQFGNFVRVDTHETGSPVFRNADGTPKSSITGRLYPLEKAFAKQAAQGGFTLTDPSRAPGKTKLSVEDPFIPQTLEEIAAVAALSPDDGGVGLVRQLSQSSDPVTKALADTLQKNYGESLRRIFVRVMNMSHEGIARTVGNREAEIRLSHAILLSKDPVRRDQVLMHELLHGLTLSELDNPTKKGLVDELTAQRERLIARLPESKRNVVRDALANDWMQKYATGDESVSMADLDRSGDWQQVIYGLLNNHEFISQGFTDRTMQKFLAALSAPNGKKGFAAFTDWVKRLIGFDPKTSDSELAHFVDISSRIMKQGEYVSDVGNFTDSWFAQKGYAPELVREQSRKALEVIQSSGIAASKELMLHSLTTREPITKEYLQAKKRMEEMYAEQGEDAQAAHAVLGEMQTPVETIDGLLATHLSENVSDMADAMDMLPEPVTQYLFERAKDMKDVLEAVHAAATEKNEGLVNLVKPKELRGPVKESLAAINKFLKIEAGHEQDKQLLRRMQNVAPDAFFDSVLSVPSPGPKAPDQGLLASVGDFIGRNGGRAASHFLQQPAQIARSNPVFAEWYSKAMMLNAQVRNMASASMKIFGRTLDAEGKLSERPVKEELDRTYKALQSPALRTALDKLLWLKQERGKNKVGPIDYSDPEVAKALSGLSPAERENLITLDNKIRLSKVAADQQTLHSMQEVFSTLAARVTMRDTGMKMEPAVDAANKVFSGLLQMDTNPSVANATLSAVASKMTPDAFLNLLKFSRDSVEQHQAYAKYLADNSDWVSAQRNGSFIFEYLKGGKMVKASAENKKDALQRSGGREILNWRKNDRDENDAVFLGENASDIIPRLRELEQNQIEMLKNVMDPVDLAEFQRTSPIAQFEREAASQQRGVDKAVGNTRKLSKGAEELPWFENHIDWINKNASYWQKRLLRTQGETMTLEPGTSGTATADMIKQHMSELLQRDPEIARQIQAVASTWSIGFNVATQIANSTQTYMRGVTELIGLGHGPIAALREISQAWSDYAGHKVGDKPYRTPEEAKFIKDALHDGQIDASIFDDQAAANDAAATNFKRVINKERPKTVGQHVASAAGAYATAGMWMFKYGERANNEVTLLATYRSLKKLRPDVGFEELKKQAYLVNASVNDVGGRANRPLGLYSGKGDFARTVAMTASSLQSYLLGSTFQLIRNVKAGLFRPQGLTPAEVFAARKAALYQLAVQFAAAGTLGMPFVSGALALLNQAFPELELNKKVRESVSSLLSGDGENGHILSDMALSGVPSMMGWDFQSRLSAGNMLPGVSEYNGFQPEQLLGVPASLVSRFVNGGKSLAAGDSQGAYAFVPLAFQKIAKLVSGDATKDYRGRPTLSATPGETLGLALGFQPKRLSDLNAADRMATQSEKLATRRAGQENQRLAGEVLKGNFGTVRQSLQQQMQADKTYNAPDAIRAIARASEELTFPKDLRREGNRRDMDSRAKLLSSFQIDPSSASEVARLQFRRQVEQRLGLTATSSRDEQVAIVMDQLRRQDPNATRASLKVAAEQTLRRTSPSPLVLQ